MEKFMLTISFLIFNFIESKSVYLFSDEMRKQIAIIILNNTRYPVEERELGIGGKVVAYIKIEQNGEMKTKVLGENMAFKNAVNNALLELPKHTKINNLNKDTLLMFNIYFAIGQKNESLDPNSISIVEYKVDMSGKEVHFKEPIHDGEWHYTRAIVYSHTNELNEAINYYKLAEKKGIKNADLYYNLATSYYKVNKRDSACYFWNIAYKKYFDTESGKIFQEKCTK